MTKILLILMFTLSLINAKNLTNFNDCTPMQVDDMKIFYLCGEDKYLIEYSKKQPAQNEIKNIYFVKNGERKIVDKF